MSKITNTQTETMTLEKILTMSSGGIEAQEADGQAELVRAEQIPVEIMTSSPELYAENKEIYAKLGIEVIGQSDGDELFYDVRLPDGWKIEATEHSMWSLLLDNFGRRRGSVFYKAALYDRKAHFILTIRYEVECYLASDAHGCIVDYGGEKYTHIATYVTDGGNPQHLIGVRDKTRGLNVTVPDQRTLAESWLDENYPDWKNPFAYWN